MIYIIFGPTGSGKTNLAINLIKTNREYKKDGEIISADSRQIYKGMDIGTNKEIDKYKSNKINYHLIDILFPDEKFNVYDWNRKVEEIIKETDFNLKDLYIVGGSGLYLDSLLYPKKYIKFSDYPENNKAIQIDNLDLFKIQELFSREFPNYYNKLNTSEKANKRRLISNYNKSSKNNNLTNINNNNYLLKLGSFELITKEYSRMNLYGNINLRVEKMFDEGFLEEVKTLVEKGYENYESLKGIGYKELVRYIRNNPNNITSLNLIKENIKQTHRNYAKRQITWFNKYYKDFQVKTVK